MSYTMYVPTRIIFGNAKKNGVTAGEMAELITHAAFYAGWPNAWDTFNLAKDIYEGAGI